MSDPITTSTFTGDAVASPAHHRMTAEISTDLAVLIVEDHVDTAEMLRRYLTRRGIAAETVGSGADALQLLCMVSRKPRCLILDQAMPGMTGLELLRHLRENPEFADLPVYFYSAAFERGKQAQAMAMGAKGWYIKGISRLDELMRGVIDCCSH